MLETLIAGCLDSNDGWITLWEDDEEILSIPSLNPPKEPESSSGLGLVVSRLLTCGSGHP